VTSEPRPAPFLADFGGRVRARRKQRGITVGRLAELSAVSRRMLTAIELGQANPSLVTVDKIARALDTDLASLALAGQAAPEVLSVRPGRARPR
jgi:transcriptional regulator with XRE-family HTH domain